MKLLDAVKAFLLALATASASVVAAAENLFLDLLESDGWTFVTHSEYMKILGK